MVDNAVLIAGMTAASGIVGALISRMFPSRQEKLAEVEQNWKISQETIASLRQEVSDLRAQVDLLEGQRSKCQEELAKMREEHAQFATDLLILKRLMTAAKKMKA